jgi:hypothetical protein
MTLHIYQGLCPDAVTGEESRDPECPACRALQLQHRHDELVIATAWRSPDEHPIPFYHVNLWLKDYTATYYGYRTNDGKWLMFDSVRFVPVIAPVQGWQYPPAVPGAEPLWKMQAASIAAEQIQELTAEVERLRQQLSSATAMLEIAQRTHPDSIDYEPDFAPCFDDQGGMIGRPLEDNPAARWQDEDE